MDNRNFEVDIVNSYDGTALKVCIWNRSAKNTIVMCNGIGGPSDMFKNFGGALPSTIRLITWDIKGSPGEYKGCPDRINVHTHVHDIIRIAEEYEINEFTMAGYCYGAEVALLAASYMNARIKRVLVINGTYPMEERPKSVSDLFMESILDPVAKSEEEARNIYAMLRSIQDDDQKINSFTSGLDRDPELGTLFRRPFETLESFRRHCRVLLALSKSDRLDTWIGRVDAPCFSFTYENDQVANPVQTEYLKKYLPELQAFNMGPGDHYSGVYDERLFSKVTSIVAGDVV